MSAATVHPAKAEPKEKPANIVITAAFLDRLGMYSDVSAMALGIAPPIPNPVNMRYVTSCDTDVAVAVSSDPMPNVSAHAISIGLRPKRSAKIGRASCRERVEISVGAGSLKKKKSRRTQSIGT